MELRRADPSEAALLGALAQRSKAHWGYSPEFMAACRAELSYTPDDLGCDTSSFMVAVVEGQIVGFYALERVRVEAFELAALFVEPQHIGRGIGRALIEHAKQAVAQAGVRLLVIQGDPHAERFYLAAGAVPAGQRESASIPGRMLPLFLIEVS
jgi:GNAT superfamily N-acetyltransferase